MMKYMYMALIAVGILSTGLVQAKEEEIKKHTKHAKKYSVYKKTSKPTPRPAQVKSYRMKPKQKGSVYKNVTKRAQPTNATTATTQAPAAASTAPVATAPKATDETAYQKFSNWLGLGTGAAATTAAAKATVGHHRAAGYHIGPRDWHHNFPSWWAERGWTAADVDGVWYFGGHPIEWWASKPEYASYYKNVIRPEYLKAHPEKR